MVKNITGKVKCNLEFEKINVPTEGLVASYFVDKADGTNETNNVANLTMTNATTYTSGSITDGPYFVINNNVSGTLVTNSLPHSTESPYKNYSDTIPAISASLWIKDYTRSGYNFFDLGANMHDVGTWNNGKKFAGYLQKSDNIIQLRWSNSSGNGPTARMKNDKYSWIDDEWNHIVASIGLNSLDIFINGEHYNLNDCISNGTNNSSCYNCSMPLSSGYFNDIKNYILMLGGQIATYQGGSQPSKGIKYSNIRFYARKLTDEDAEALYNNGKGV